VQNNLRVDDNRHDRESQNPALSTPVGSTGAGTNLGPGQSATAGTGSSATARRGNNVGQTH